MPNWGSQKVYIILHELGPVKIGIAKNPKQRLSNLQISCPYHLTLYKTKNPHDAEAVEEYLHNRFNKYHMRGEWFDIPKEFRDITIPMQISETGEPDVEVPLPHTRIVNEEWAHFLERAVIAMKPTKQITPEIRELRGKWQEFILGDDDEEEVVDSVPDETEIYEDTPKGMKRCSSCGHHYDRTEIGCPTCGSGSSTEPGHRDY